MSNYPRDEFDAIEESSARHGVHRASMEAQGRSLVPLMVVGVAVLCVGLLAFFIMPKMLNNSTPPPAAESSTTAPPTAPATTAAPTVAPTTEPVETPTPNADPTPDSVVDKSVAVSIFNATGVPGLAARYAGLVQADGWTVAQSANWAGQPQSVSVIFYSGVEQKANAEALGAILNIAALVDSSELGVPLAVVLGPGA